MVQAEKQNHVYMYSDKECVCVCAYSCLFVNPRVQEL